MILHEVNAALTHLLNNSQESIIITDNDTVFAEDVVYYLEMLFRSLKCDYNVERVNHYSIIVTLYQ